MYRTISRVAGVASVAVFLTLLGLLIYSQFSEDTDSQDPPTLDSSRRADAGGLPGEEVGPELRYSILDSPVLECRGREAWLTVVVIGPTLGPDTVLRVSPLSPGPSETTFNAVGGLRSIDAAVISTDSAASVRGERPWDTEDRLATTVEAKLPAFIVESEQPTFQALVRTKDPQSGRDDFSTGLRLEVAGTQCR